ncbi:MAG: DsrE family protein [Gammaproteobacteria bacterium]|nr:DsrE family protein [Gammaproteobacteria bacterium]MDE2250115.1 DsrE family protein [Gammaproteobacteria bacterium]
MNYLFILNDPAYGTERSYNALRLAGSLAKDAQHSIKVFLIGEGATCAHRNQKLPQGHYSIEVMLKAVVRNGGEVGVCASCMDARGIADAELVEGTHRSSLDQLTAWTSESQQVLVF